MTIFQKSYMKTTKSASMAAVKSHGDWILNQMKYES